MQSVGQIIAAYRKKKGYSQPELAARLKDEGIDISYKSISSWEKQGSEPNITTFLTLCRILGIADVYEEYYGINPLNPLSKLNDEGKEKVIEYSDLLYESGKYGKCAADIIAYPTRHIRLYTTMVSAGTGNFLDGEEYDVIEVGKEVPDTADFGVRITGDSMEPRFTNHQTVWVHKQNYLQTGEIGIFYLNNMSYCKKLQNDKKGQFLVSLNKKYAPLPIVKEDSFKIFGRVVG